MEQSEPQWRKKNGDKQGLHSCATQPNTNSSIMLSIAYMYFVIVSPRQTISKTPGQYMVSNSFA